MEKLRIGFIGVAAAVLGFAVQGCFTPQPLPECTIVGSQAAFGVTPYWAQLKAQGAPAGADCSAFPTDLRSMAVGMQRWFQPDGGSKPFRVAIRPSRLTDMWNGEVFPALNQDPSNDCTNEMDCGLCVVTLADGGLALGADNSIPVVNDMAMYPDGGSEAVDSMNECMIVPEDYYPVDSADPDGKKLIGEASFAAQFPDKDGVCSLENFIAAEQNFDAVTTYNLDGTTNTVPSEQVTYDWSNFKIVSTTKVPGTGWTATLKLTEGTCSASYDVTAFWPIVGCEEDSDCNPAPDTDAGQLFGSGINPLFKPVCNKDLDESGTNLIGYIYGTSGVCTPSVDLTTLK